MIPLIDQLLSENRALGEVCSILLEQNKAACRRAFDDGAGDISLLVRFLETAQKAQARLADFYLAQNEGKYRQMVQALADFADGCVRIRCLVETKDCVYGSETYRRCENEVHEVLLSKKVGKKALSAANLVAEAEAAKAKRLADYEARQAEAAKKEELRKEAFQREDERRRKDRAAALEIRKENARRANALSAYACRPVRNLSEMEAIKERLALENERNRRSRYEPIETRPEYARLRSAW